MNRDDVVEALEKGFEVGYCAGADRPSHAGPPTGHQIKAAMRESKGMAFALASLSEAQPEEGLVEKLQMARGLIEEAKGYEGERGGPITDHLDAADSEILDVEERLAALSRNHDEALIEKAIRKAEADGFLSVEDLRALKGDSK